jgi:hypothetical protein
MDRMTPVPYGYLVSIAILALPVLLLRLYHERWEIHALLSPTRSRAPP